MKELELMLETREKAEIRTSLVAASAPYCSLTHLLTHSPAVPSAEALSSFGFQYLSETYLPLKLQEVWHAPERCTPRKR